MSAILTPLTLTRPIPSSEPPHSSNLPHRRRPKLRRPCPPRAASLQSYLYDITHLNVLRMPSGSLGPHRCNHTRCGPRLAFRARLYALAGPRTTRWENVSVNAGLPEGSGGGGVW